MHVLVCVIECYFMLILTYFVKIKIKYIVVFECNRKLFCCLLVQYSRCV